MNEKLEKLIKCAHVAQEEMDKTIIEIIEHFKEDQNLLISEEDVKILLKEGKYKDISYLRDDIIEEDSVQLFSNMTELLSWQKDGEFDAIEPLKEVFNYTIDENFIKEYKELGCNSLADYYSAKNKEELGTRVYLTNCVAYIYG